MIGPKNEHHIRAVAVALHDYLSPRGKPFDQLHLDTQYKHIDRAAWVLSVAAQALSPEGQVVLTEGGQ